MHPLEVGLALLSGALLFVSGLMAGMRAAALRLPESASPRVRILLAAIEAEEVSTNRRFLQGALADELRKETKVEQRLLAEHLGGFQ